MKRVLPPLLAALLLGAPQLKADDDHEIARRAVERGELRPLATILAAARRDYPGRLLEVGLDRDDGRFVYEIEVLLEDGHIIELTYDGQSGELIESEMEDD